MIVLAGIIGIALSLEASPTPKPSPAATETLDKDFPNSADPMAYTYNPFGKRDPFRSFLSDKSGNRSDSKDPLLNYDLSKFSLTGILWGISNPKAIVVDGGGRGHVISRGTRMGRNKGQVIRILKDEIVVAEEYRDPLGKLMVTEQSLKLTRKDEER